MGCTRPPLVGQNQVEVSEPRFISINDLQFLPWIIIASGSQRHHLLSLSQNIRARSGLAPYTSQKSFLGNAQLLQLHQVIGVETETPKTEAIWPRLNRELGAKRGLESRSHCSRPGNPLSQWCLLFFQASLEPATHSSLLPTGYPHHSKPVSF